MLPSDAIPGADEIGAPPLVPEWVMKAIRDIPTCPRCGEGVLTKGRTKHVICELIDTEETA